MTSTAEAAYGIAAARSGTLPAALRELGLPNPSDRQLAAMVSARLGAPAKILSTCFDRHPYKLPAITTRDRFQVSGIARTSDGQDRSYAFFVKVTQSWARSPLSHEVPEPLRSTMAPLLPWRTERDLYLSDLCDRLPAGLIVPRAFGVFDLDDESTAVWLDMVSVRALRWDVERHRRAAYLLGHADMPATWSRSEGAGWCPCRGGETRTPTRNDS